MCEWLSYGEWCDVKLLCGGRTFNAHRAVLASVSGFLRQILLSCTPDDMPTCIVLPDFDFDAMSSVLYYIYNGEVLLPKHKVDFFLDIVKAMQIFIDYRNLRQIYDGYKDVPIDLNVNSNFIHLSTNSIFTLGAEDCKDQSFINLKRVKEARDTTLQYSLSKPDHPDKRCQNRSEHRKSCLGNLKSPYGDRQRNSFLRDLYIETYPRNGNANGLKASVLAISNEYYRAPASVLLTNANGKNLNANDTLTETYKKPIGLSFFSTDSLDLGKQKCEQNANGNCKMISHRNMSNVALINSHPDRFVKGNSSIDFRVNMHPTTNFNVQSSSNISISEDSIVVKLSNQTIKDSEHFNTELNNNNCARVLNHVLESPWCPRVPNNYRPFRRKLENTDEERKLDQNTKELQDFSDSNNNVHKPVLLPNVDQTTISNTVCTLKEQISPELPHPITQLQQDLKCNICSQVFTSDYALNAHKKRHSTGARYACGECGKTFSQLRNFKYHMSIHKGTKEFAATCTVCGKYFNDRGYLSSHMKIHRNRKEYKCSQCPKSFNQRVAYNMHVRIHTGVKPHVCEECGKAFSRKMLLKQHRRTHSGERPYACPHCDKRFADRSNMTLHLRLHTGIKPFSCSLCPKSFTKKHHLKSHLNFHTGSKPYSCPRCKLAFTQSSNMRTHLKKCNAPEPTPEANSPQK